MKRFLLFLSLLSCSGATWAQSVDSTAYDNMLLDLLSHTVKEVAVNQCPQDGSVVYVDSREKKEYQVSHIKGAVWVGYDNFDASRMGDVAKDTPIVVYCSVGYRSEKIAEKLRDMGYTNVSNLYGGIFEWVNQGQTVYNNNPPTKAVHAYDKNWGQWLNRGKKVY